MKMTVKFKRVIAVALLAVVLSGFIGCTETGMTLDEISDVLPTLVEQSAVLNEIYFGQGFPPSAENGSVGNYYYVDGEYYGFNSITEIKEATEKVFSSEYCLLLYAAAFDGVADDDNALPPRYAEGELGLMQSMNSKTYSLSDRTYDYGTLAFEKRGDDRATVSVDTYANGKTERIELIIIRSENAAATGDTVVTATAAVAPTYTYRLDSPTY